MPGHRGRPPAARQVPLPLTRKEPTHRWTRLEPDPHRLRQRHPLLDAALGQVADLDTVEGQVGTRFTRDAQRRHSPHSRSTETRSDAATRHFLATNPNSLASRLANSSGLRHFNPDRTLDGRRLPGHCLRFHVKHPPILGRWTLPHPGSVDAAAKRRRGPRGDLVGLRVRPLRASAAGDGRSRPILVSTEVSKRGGRLPSIACGFHVEHPGHRQVQTSGPADPSWSTATVSRESSWASPRVRTCGRQPSGIAAVRREKSDRTPRPPTHAGDGPPARPSRPVHLASDPGDQPRPYGTCAQRLGRHASARPTQARSHGLADTLSPNAPLTCTPRAVLMGKEVQICGRRRGRRPRRQVPERGAPQFHVKPPGVCERPDLCGRPRWHSGAGVLLTSWGGRCRRLDLRALGHRIAPAVPREKCRAGASRCSGATPRAPARFHVKHRSGAGCLRSDDPVGRFEGTKRTASFTAELGMRTCGRLPRDHLPTTTR